MTMKTAYFRALMISVLAGFASQVLASAQTETSVTDRNWIKGQQDALAAMKEGMPDPGAGLPVLPQAQQDLINRPGQYRGAVHHDG
jgi:conjugal transfer pilus assembly protein TrbC